MAVAVTAAVAAAVTAAVAAAVAAAPVHLSPVQQTELPENCCHVIAEEGTVQW